MKVLTYVEYAKYAAWRMFSKLAFDSSGILRLNFGNKTEEIVWSKAQMKDLKIETFKPEYFRVDNGLKSDYFFDDKYLFSLEFEDKTLNHFSDEEMIKLTMMK